MTKWEKNDGYSGCKTAYFGDLAVVICPPEYSGDGWGYQAFDESDPLAADAIECEYEEYGFKSERDVMEYVEDCMR